MIELFRILRYKTFRHYSNTLSIYVKQQSNVKNVSQIMSVSKSICYLNNVSWSVSFR